MGAKTKYTILAISLQRISILIWYQLYSCKDDELGSDWLTICRLNKYTSQCFRTFCFRTFLIRSFWIRSFYILAPSVLAPSVLAPYLLVFAPFEFAHFVLAPSILAPFLIWYYNFRLFCHLSLQYRSLYMIHIWYQTMYSQIFKF